MRFIDKVFDVPVVWQRQIPVILQKNCGGSTGAYIENCVVPVVLQRQVPTIRTVDSVVSSLTFGRNLVICGTVFSTVPTNCDVVFQDV